ncbi:MAG: hybrid sensor histidine kinase/response regulator [Vampirovibrionales bacterium]|nr:hybrid sensor histidine kinase/response regulator [Vampirovibrionales bacterium]
MSAAEHSGAPRVMIVDDEPMVTASVCTMLALDTDYQTFPFNHPGQALEALADIAPDVVISDFLMPEMDGLAFLRAVKAKLPESTLILLTGYADKENAIAAINAVGIYKYIEKPWDNDVLKLSIKNGLERARLLADLRRAVSELTDAQSQLQAYNQRLETLVEARTADWRRAHRQLASIVEETADGIITLSPQGRIETMNPAARRLWRARRLADPERLSSEPLPLDWPIDDVLTVAAGAPPISRLLLSAEVCMASEAALGETIVEASVAPLRDPVDGGVLRQAAQEPDASLGPAAPAPTALLGFVLVLRDISARKEMDRLRDDFVSTLTHDLRTPLLAAIQTLAFFEDGSLGPLTDRQREFSAMLIQSQRDLLGLVNVLLEVYKYESGRQRLVLDAVPPAPLLSGICRELEALARSREQTFSLSISPALAPLWGDKQELRRVFMNLLGNALHHTPSGGRIEVGARAETDSATMTLWVRDTGRGIPKADQAALFQRFFQSASKVRNSGTGLGLYLSRQIVEAHRGDIWVESVEGQGSCFYVRLPLEPVQTAGDDHGAGVVAAMVRDGSLNP